MTDLRPLAVTRLAMLATGLYLAVACVAAGIAEAETVAGLVSGAGALCCVYAGIRGWRYRIRLEGQTMHIRGVLWNRRIARSAVAGISHLPAVRWQAGRSRRWSPLVALFVDAGVLPAVRRRTDAVVEQLSSWASTPP